MGRELSEIDVIEAISIAAPIVSAMVAVAVLTWWLSKQFGEIRTDLSNGLRDIRVTIDDKMRIHEVRDEERFEALNRRLFGIELRNAIRDGKLPPDFEERKGS